MGAQAILFVYSILMLLSYWSQLADIETTVRLVGSDVGCSLSAIECNWFNFAIEKIVGVAVIGLAGSSLFLRKIQRDRIIIGATLLAIAHLVVSWLLFNPS